MLSVLKYYSIVPTVAGFGIALNLFDQGIEEPVSLMTDPLAGM